MFATSPILTTPNLGTPSALVGTNITGTAVGLTAGNVTTNANLTGEVTSVGNATTLTNAAVIGKVLTGYTAASGTVAAADNILEAIQKLDGNNATKQSTLTNSAGLAGALSDETGTGLAVFATSPTLTTPAIKGNGGGLTTLANPNPGNYTLTMPTASGTVALTSNLNNYVLINSLASRTSIPDDLAPQMPGGSSLFNYFTLTRQTSSLSFGAPSGTPLDGYSLIIKITKNKDVIPDPTELSITWDTEFYRGGSIQLPNITNKTTIIQFIYNSEDSKWDLISVASGI